LKNKFLLIAALLLTPNHENNPAGEELIASTAPILTIMSLPAIAYIGIVGFIAYASANFIE